jgi:hypothetical protein
MEENLRKFFLLNLVFLIACSSTQKGLKTRETNNISNYILLDYVDLLSAKDYYPLLDSIKNGKSNDFFTLRMAYTKTEEYNPYSVELDELRNSIEFNIEEKRFEKALEIADKILGNRYIDIKTHLYCAKIYKQLNNNEKADYHYNIYDGLLNSIYFSGDGRSAETAFIIMEISEEYDLMKWLDFEYSKQYLMLQDHYSFDIFEVFDENEKTELFFNTALALKRLSEETD